MNLAGTEINVVDLIALAIVLSTVAAGIRQGFINGVLDLFALAAAMYVAFKGYGYVGARLVEAFPLPRGIVNLGAFAGIFILSQILFSSISGLVAGVTRPMLRLVLPLRWANAAAGTLPGLVKGVITVTVLMLPFGLFPIIPEVKNAIETSFAGSRLIPLASQAAPRLESLLGQTAEETLAFLSRPQPGVPLNLDFSPPSSLSLDAISENRMLELVNGERIKNGFQPLVMDDKLRAAARSHSQEMFELSYFAHESPVDGTPADRIRATGARFTMAAENLAYAPNVEMAHSGLMNSPGHRKNILTPDFRRVGVGVIDGGLQGKMFTQNFTD